MELFVLVLFVIGWLLIAFAAFGSGLDLHVGHLTTIETAIVFVLIALCLGYGWRVRDSLPRRNP